MAGGLGRACLILGELCLDVHATLGAEGGSVAPLLEGSDVTTHGEIAGLPGGTGWLFADALSTASDVVPLILAAVGDDWAGEFLAGAVTARGWPADGIVRPAGSRTDIVATTSFAGRARLMAIPAEKISRKFLPWDLRLTARLSSAYDVGFAWVAGYMLENYEPTVAESIKDLFGLVRELGIPIVLDLVPHDFLARVGPLSQVEADVGPIDVIVGEYTTLTGLGFGPPPSRVRDDDSDATAGMLACARSAARGRLGAVVQHRVSADAYSQVVVGQYVGELTMLRPVPESGPRGMGDALAVQALRALRLIRDE